MDSRQDIDAGPPGFVGWWEAIHLTVDGEVVDVSDVVERIDSSGVFEVFLDGVQIGGGRHVDFVEDPPGFTNIQDMTNSFADQGPQLVIYRLTGDVLEFCKAPEGFGRPTAFASATGSGWIHGAIRRIRDADPRIPTA